MGVWGAVCACSSNLRSPPPTRLPVPPAWPKLVPMLRGPSRVSARVCSTRFCLQTKNDCVFLICSEIGRSCACACAFKKAALIVGHISSSSLKVSNMSWSFVARARAAVDVLEGLGDPCVFACIGSFVDGWAADLLRPLDSASFDAVLRFPLPFRRWWSWAAENPARHTACWRSSSKTNFPLRPIRLRPGNLIKMHSNQLLARAKQNQFEHKWLEPKWLSGCRCGVNSNIGPHHKGAA